MVQLRALSDIVSARAEAPALIFELIAKGQAPAFRHLHILCVECAAGGGRSIFLPVAAC
jgi:hypothetical protein